MIRLGTHRWPPALTDRDDRGNEPITLGAAGASAVARGHHGHRAGPRRGSLVPDNSITVFRLHPMHNGTEIELPTLAFCQWKASICTVLSATKHTPHSLNPRRGSQVMEPEAVDT
jgi:hypothetical protein